MHGVVKKKISAVKILEILTALYLEKSLDGTTIRLQLQFVVVLYSPEKPLQFDAAVGYYYDAEPNVPEQR